MADFEQAFGELKDGLKSLVLQTVKKRGKQAVEDSKAYADSLREDLEKWTRQVADGELSAEDLQWLVDAKKDLAEMILMKQKGLSLVAIDNFKEQATKLLISTVMKGVGR